MKPDIDKLKALGEYQRAYNWWISFIGNAPVWGKDAGLGSGKSISKEIFHCTAVTLPRYISEEVKIKVKGVTLYQPGRSEFGGRVALEFIETEDCAIRKIFTKWFDAQHSISENVSSKTLVTRGDDKGCTVDMWLVQTSASNDIPTATYRLTQCSLSAFDFGKMDSSGDIIHLTAELSVSRILCNPVGYDLKAESMRNVGTISGWSDLFEKITG